MLRAAVAAVLIAVPLAATGADVELPIQLDEAFLERALVEQVFGESGGAVELRSADGCGRVTLSPRGLAAEPGGLRVRTQVQSRFGIAFAGLCWLTTDVEGDLEVLQTPEVDADRPVVHLRVRDSRWTPRSEPFWLPGEGAYRLVRELVHPRLESFAVDLSQPMQELRELPRLVWSEEHRDAAERMAASLELSGVETREDALVLVLRFEVPDDAPDVPRVDEPALSPEEIAAFEAAWQRWDAFLAFIVKQIGAGAPQPEQREALADVLLDARHDLVAVLEAPPAGADPVPGLFVATWERLAPVMRALLTRVPAESAPRYLAFVAAGDAVSALHALSPVGVDLSDDGLRRLARLVAPAAEEDPLLYSAEVDPALRELLGFGPPIPLPALRSDVPAPPASRWTRLARGLAALLVSTAHAASSAVPAANLELEEWAPTREDVDEYLDLVGSLLRSTAEEVAHGDEGLPDPWPARFVPLVLATGWQESCWRQWVRRRGEVVPLRSGAGAVGILQVNVHVWRGLYDRDALTSDIGYNARAGSEILRHYLVDYALRRLGAAERSDAELVARATYALYHGGPRHLRRPIEGAPTAALRAIDTAFVEKYEAVRAGQPEEQVASCY